MTVIATASNPRFSVSRVDIDRGGPTYTRDTLRDLQALNPDADLYFITGADALASILTWQDWEEMFALARFVGVSRPGYELDGKHIAAAPEGDAARRADPRRGACAGDLVDRLPQARRGEPADLVPGARRRRAVRRPSAASTASHALAATGAARGDRLRRRHQDGDGRRAGGLGQTRRRRRRHRRVRPAGDHRLLRDRVGVQRASGQRHRRRGRGEDAAGRLQTGTPRGRPRRPLDAAGLRRHRRAHPASGRAQFLCAGPVVAGLPDRSRRSGREPAP